MIDINTTCEEAVENIRVLAETRNMTISLATNGPLPFRADPEDLHLMEQPTGKRSAWPWVEAATTRDGANAKVVVEDHGSGISATDLPHIFRTLLSVEIIPQPCHRRFRPRSWQSPTRS